MEIEKRTNGKIGLLLRRRKKKLERMCPDNGNDYSHIEIIFTRWWKRSETHDKDEQKKKDVILNRKIATFKSIVLLHLTHMKWKQQQQQTQIEKVQRSNKTMLSMLSQILLVCAFKFHIIDETAAIWIEKKIHMHTKSISNHFSNNRSIHFTNVHHSFAAYSVRKKLQKNKLCTKNDFT